MSGSTPGGGQITPSVRASLLLRSSRGSVAGAADWPLGGGFGTAFWRSSGEQASAPSCLGCCGTASAATSLGTNVQATSNAPTMRTSGVEREAKTVSPLIVLKGQRLGQPTVPPDRRDDQARTPLRAAAV